jgi:hypothetical protein
MCPISPNSPPKHIPKSGIHTYTPEHYCGSPLPTRVFSPTHTLYNHTRTIYGNRWSAHKCLRFRNARHTLRLVSLCPKINSTNHLHTFILIFSTPQLIGWKSHMVQPTISTYSGNINCPSQSIFISNKDHIYARHNPIPTTKIMVSTICGAQ